MERETRQIIGLELPSTNTDSRSIQKSSNIEKVVRRDAGTSPFKVPQVQSDLMSKKREMIEITQVNTFDNVETSNVQMKSENPSKVKSMPGSKQRKMSN